MIRKILLVALIGSFAIGPKKLVAQENEPERVNQSPLQTNRGTTSEIDQKLNHLLKLSDNTVSRMNTVGISRLTIDEQEKLRQQLKIILKEINPEKLETVTGSNSTTKDQRTIKETSNPLTSSGNISEGDGGSSLSDSPQLPGGSSLNLRDKLADAVWGHLPPRERNDLIRTYNESYLPEYEDQVKNYFEQLSKLKIRTSDDRIKHQQFEPGED